MTDTEDTARDLISISEPFQSGTITRITLYIGYLGPVIFTPGLIRTTVLRKQWVIRIMMYKRVVFIR